MQRNNSVKLNNNKTSVYKTFCKVCQDAGKTDKEYTNHNVRDRTGKTLCPTLLAQECRNCYKHGHTVKYCPLVKTETKKPYEAPVKVVPQKSKNVFMLLESDSEEENEDVEVEEPINEFPVLKQVQSNIQPLNYSRLISMTEEETKEAANKKVANKKAEVKTQPEVKTQHEVKTQPEVKAQKGKLDWATAESDSEGDEEEEDYYPVIKPFKQDLSAW
jgi:hypothetical protein